MLNMRRLLPLWLILWISLAACTRPQKTVTAATPGIVAADSLVPTAIPAQNGWTETYTASIPAASVVKAAPEEIARVLFTQWLEHFKTPDADSRNRLDDYEVLKVQLPETLAHLAQEKDVDFIATVGFSVKPTVYMYSHWNAGNGISTDDIWVRKKGLIVGVDRQGATYNLLLIGTGP